MNLSKRLHRQSTDGPLESSLAPYAEAFTHYLTEQRYARHTVTTYLACVAHFASWTNRCQLGIAQINENVVDRFLRNHLPHCDCPRPVRRVHHELRAALGHLLVVLRAKNVLPQPMTAITPVDEELRRFDDHMDRVHGRAPTTRKMHSRPRTPRIVSSPDV